ncbi:hypothetical protein JCM3770_003399 [Rhodotorula araucariae]
MLDITPVTLHYFPIQGRGEPIRYLLADAGISFSESNDVAQFQAHKWDWAQYRFNQLPRLTVTRDGPGPAGDGGRVEEHLAQQGAILRFLARAAGYGAGAGLWHEALVDQVQDACEDLNGTYTRCIYAPDAPVLLRELVKTTVPKVMKQFEYIFAHNKSEAGYLAFDQPSYAEFHLLYLLHALQKLQPSLLSAYPALAAWEERMRARPGLKRYQPVHKMLNGNANGQGEVPLE